MKSVFKCEYCNFIGTEEDVQKHEGTCIDNYDKRSCYTCTHRTLKNLKQFGCKCGIEIPECKIFEFCKSYDRKEKSETPLTNIFGSMFGGF